MEGEIHHGEFHRLRKFSWGRETGNTIVSNQSLFAPEELNYIAHQWINTTTRSF
jgi:hypothetical protein